MRFRPIGLALLGALLFAACLARAQEDREPSSAPIGANQAPVPVRTGGGGYTAYPPGYNYGAPTPNNSLQIRAFDDKVFDLSPKGPGPSVSKSPRTGTERSMDDEPEYNSGQRREWLDTCASRKDGDLKAYRTCYQNEKRKSADAARKGLLGDPKLDSPFRNTNQIPLLEEQKNPSFEPPQEED